MMDQDVQSTDSLYDYFYLDTPRIHSLTSQIFDTGVLTNLKQTSSDTDGVNNSVSVDLKIIKAAVGATESIGRTQERLFDSSWSAPLELISRLQELDRIRSGLTDRKLGELVLISGGMKIFDATMITEAMPVMKKIGNLTGVGPKGKQENTFYATATEIMKILPKSTQIDFADTDGNSVWMSVDANNLTIGSGDIALKYGNKIPGTWHVVGFVDAHPDHIVADADTPYPENTNDLRVSLDHMLDLIRTTMGRDSRSYGITPLMIFRTIR